MPQTKVTQSAQEVADFWFNTLTPKDWYTGGEALDQRCRDLFGETWQHLMQGALEHWCSSLSSMMGYLILADQLPRNMHRDTANAFASDDLARAACKMALTAGWDMQVETQQRQFIYMPLMHSESIVDQERCVRLMKDRMGAASESLLLHARAHREVIRRYGRFPTRNIALGRISSTAEQAYLDQGGYGAIIQALTKA